MSVDPEQPSAILREVLDIANSASMAQLSWELRRYGQTIRTATALDAVPTVRT